MTIELRPFQVTARDFLLANPRAILGDEMGVGKSYPAIDAAALQFGPTLVICPAYLMYQWKQMIKEYASVRNNLIEVVEGSPAKKTNALNTLKDAPADWYIISYDTLSDALPRKIRFRVGETTPQRRVAEYKAIPTTEWGTVIFDEAHRLRGRNSLWTKAAFKLKANNIWMLTGTPIVNNPSDIWPLLKVCDAKLYSSYWRFVDQHCFTTKTPWVTEIIGARDSFAPEVNKWMLRRTREETLPELPPVQYIEVPVQIPKATLDMMAEAKKSFRVEYPDIGSVPMANAAVLVNELRRITSREEAKKYAVAEIVRDRPNNKIVIFTWFRQSAEDLASEIFSSGRTAVPITGRDPVKTRIEIIDAWNESNDGVIVATIASLKEGVNLQASSTVIFFEEDWIPSANDQAVGRLHRQGQPNSVEVFHVHARSTIDESVHRVAAKRGRVNARALLEEVYK